MPTDAKRKFIELLSCALSGKILDTTNVSDWNELMKLIAKNNAWSFAYYAFDSEKVPEKVNALVSSKFLSLVAQQIKQEYYEGLVFDELEKAEVDYMPMKGSLMRVLYPHKEMRVSCDVDLMVERKNLKKIRTILSCLGFVSEHGVKGDNHDTWQLDEITIEPHVAIMRGTKLGDYFSDVFKKTKAVAEGKHRMRLSDEDLYITHIAHAYKHFESGGCGVKAIADVYVYKKSFPNLNRDYLRVEFEKLKISKFVEKIEKLADCWFGDEPFDDEISLLTDYVSDGGTYGTFKQGAVMKYGKNSESATSAKRSYFIRKVFPPASELKVTYPVLEKAPILLPITWVIRWFTVLFTRFGNVKNNLNTYKDMTDEDIERARKIYEIIDE